MVLDFVYISTQEQGKGKEITYRPGFTYGDYKDLMVRGGAFYAVWDEHRRVWDESLNRLVWLVDKDIRERCSELPDGTRVRMSAHESGVMAAFERFCKSSEPNYKPLNQKVLFASDEPCREDLSTFQLSYDRHEGSTPSYDRLMSTIYIPDELRKLEWMVGSVLTGKSKDIQKMLVIFGAPGTGKSTFIKLIEMMFEGYASAFKSSGLGRSDDRFSASSFANGPLIGYEHDGDLSRIETNTTLNSIISHEVIPVEEKFKNPYQMRVDAMLIVATNSPVLMTSMESGLMRRVIDVYSSGNVLPIDEYNRLFDGLKFELGAIADRCIKVFESMGPSYYNGYRPIDMMARTNVLYNFVDNYRHEFAEAEYTQLMVTYNLYKQYCDASSEKPISLKFFKEQLKAYFDRFIERANRSEFEAQPRNIYVGFRNDVMPSLTKPVSREPELQKSWLEMDSNTSNLDHILEAQPAQYASTGGTPIAKWANVETTLSELDTTKLHYVKPPLNHIVIDFDKTNEKGEKDAEANLKAAADWPATYAEFSKSGGGLHLHYDYAGDPTKLSRVFGPGVEIKVFVGDSSLRRMLSKCNGLPVETLSSGLPLKEERVIAHNEVKTERGLRILVGKNLAKLIHPGTKPSIDFIHKILDDAYKSGLVYDLSDMKTPVVNFAMNSTNQSLYCMKLVQDMKFKSEADPTETPAVDDRLVFFDVEVFPNLFVVCWKFQGSDQVVNMVNPSVADIVELLKFRLVGFNNRRYDNHILYAAYMGYSNAQLYKLSQALINKERSPFGQAWNLSYTDIWDFNSNKQSLKKWEIELGLHHMELGLPWDQPVPAELVDKVVEYCGNDVRATEAVFDARQGDWAARKVLSELSGKSVNTPTNTHSAWIVFGTDKPDKTQFVYTPLSETFPGYTYEWGKSSYKGCDPSEGGYVNEKVGIHTDVSLLDVESMHPTSIIQLNLFGDEYTSRYRELLEARLAIKHEEHSKLENLLGGTLREYVSSGAELEPLSDALKIVLNSVYGLTSASFDNPFRDPRNVDNIVAKRGSLFMIDLNEYVKAIGLEVVHTKTDSIKVPGASAEAIALIQAFAARYGYVLAHEATYERFALVNKSTYIALSDGKWDAVGLEFQRPVVYKTLLSGEPVGFDDYVEVKEVKTSIWLDDKFVGRVGAFVPVIEGGHTLLRQDGTDPEKFSAVTGTKGYIWKEAYIERELSDGRLDNIDTSYYDALVDGAIDKLRELGDVEWLLGA